MDELKLTGNAMLGSRPLLNFDENFETSPHFQLMKCMLTDVFNTPNGHPKSKPFVDRVMSFYVVNNNIWVRNYQITDGAEISGLNAKKLVEIGPRFVLIPIRVFSGSFGGATLYQNLAYTSPNEERSASKKLKGTRYADRAEDKTRKEARALVTVMPEDALARSKIFRDDDGDEENEEY